eukprot:8837460-Ditylum_brightwellii.AAC.1
MKKKPSALLYDHQHDDLMLMFALWWREKMKKEQFILSYNRKVFFNTLPDHIKVRLSHKLRRAAVHLPPMSPCQKLYFSSNDPNLITTTGFDHTGFEWILDSFR